jgi:endogenous inhibitor of DNA gyrase (YacG/DUF329 family)
MALLTCPICRRPFDTAQTDAMPFCCERCRLVDLHRWLNETNSLLIEREEGDGEGMTKHEGMTNDE